MEQILGTFTCTKSVISFCCSVQAGMLLSEYFYDADRLEPEIQDKLQAVLKDWQGVFLNGKGTEIIQKHHG